jgi:hypothetical protein
VSRPPARQDVWDAFVDALDRAGQAGSAADVLTPADLHPEVPSGKRFGDLTRGDIDTLVKVAGNLGRHGDAVKHMWERTQQQRRAEKRRALADAKRDDAP